MADELQITLASVNESELPDSVKLPEDSVSLLEESNIIQHFNWISIWKKRKPNLNFYLTPYPPPLDCSSKCDNLHTRDFRIKSKISPWSWDRQRFCKQDIKPTKHKGIKLINCTALKLRIGEKAMWKDKPQIEKKNISSIWQRTCIQNM